MIFSGLLLALLAASVYCYERRLRARLRENEELEYRLGELTRIYLTHVQAVKEFREIGKP